jgi:DNA segregation ATPase FtsK/SpoIIIE, S-DNA-T family
VADLPSEQRQPVAVHRPGDHGHLLVLGASGSGRTTALTVLADAPGSLVLSSDPADAWHVLTGLIVPSGSGTDGRLLLIDDLDLLLGRAQAEIRHELAELLARVLREGPARGLGVVASAQRLAGPLQGMAGLFGSRLLLRMPSRDEHVLAGGVGAEFDARQPPGAGRWRGEIVQVALPDDARLPAPVSVELPLVRPALGRPLAVVASRPAPWRDRFEGAGYRVRMLGDADRAGAGSGTDHDVLLGDPDAWQAEWNLLAVARRELAIAVVGCAAAELRALTRTREIPPPLGSDPDECWLVDADGLRRARVDMTRLPGHVAP